MVSNFSTLWRVDVIQVFLDGGPLKFDANDNSFVRLSLCCRSLHLHVLKAVCCLEFMQIKQEALWCRGYASLIFSLFGQLSMRGLGALSGVKHTRFANRV